MTILRQPSVDQRAAVRYLGIRVRTPMKGMFQVADKLWKELRGWMKARGHALPTRSFLRFHVIDMAGEMDIEVGVPFEQPAVDDARVTVGTLPEGAYASLVFVGHGLPANKALLDWIRENHLTTDRWDDPAGDAFACRCETVLTDRTLYPLKKSWQIEVSIKLKTN